jgi:hypothetical protein
MVINNPESGDSDYYTDEEYTDSSDDSSDILDELFSEDEDLGRAMAVIKKNEPKRFNNFTRVFKKKLTRKKYNPFRKTKRFNKKGKKDDNKKQYKKKGSRTKKFGQGMSSYSIVQDEESTAHVHKPKKSILTLLSESPAAAIYKNGKLVMDNKEYSAYSMSVDINHITHTHNDLVAIKKANLNPNNPNTVVFMVDTGACDTLLGDEYTHLAHSIESCTRTWFTADGNPLHATGLGTFCVKSRTLSGNPFTFRMQAYIVPGVKRPLAKFKAQYCSSLNDHKSYYGLPLKVKNNSTTQGEYETKLIKMEIIHVNNSYYVPVEFLPAKHKGCKTLITSSVDVQLMYNEEMDDPAGVYMIDIENIDDSSEASQDSLLSINHRTHPLGTFPIGNNIVSHIFNESRPSDELNIRHHLEHLRNQMKNSELIHPACSSAT